MFNKRTSFIIIFNWTHWTFITTTYLLPLTCPFVEHLAGDKVVFKEIIDDDFMYSEDKGLEYIIPVYVGYKDE